MKQIGWVGLGHMGLPMAVNLIKAGYTVIGFDQSPDAVRAFEAQGGKGALDPQALWGSEVLITMLQTGEQVKQVCLGAQGLFAHSGSKTLYMDCSSIDVSCSREITQAATVAGLEAVDAPVSGGTAGAAAATLTFMVGGEVSVFERALPFLQAMGSAVIHAGAAGSGQIAKICNNMLLGISMIGVSECFLLAQQLGLSAEKLYEIVMHASGRCWVMEKYVPVPDLLPNVPANHDYVAGFTAAMMLKDLRLSQTAAASVGVETPMGARALALYEALAAAGMSEKDFSVMMRFLGLSRLH